jgi:hypothetical protein
MRLNEKQSLEYLKEVGFDIGPATFYREKRKVENLKLKRLYHIAQIGFQDQHLDRIDNTELCLKLMWENYHLEQDPYKKFQMLKDIIMVQPYLSAYYEATKLIVEKQKRQQNDKLGYDQQQDDIMINDDEEEFNNDSNSKF